VSEINNCRPGPQSAVPFDPTEPQAWLATERYSYSDTYPSDVEAHDTTAAETAVASLWERLPELHREVLELVHVAGLTKTEAAEILGLSNRHKLARVLLEAEDLLHTWLVETGHDLDEEPKTVSKEKKQGTSYETATVRAAIAAGLRAERLAEGGSADIGDVRSGDYIFECKARQRLVIHDALAKAIKKSGTEQTALFWKRLVPVAGSNRRQPVGLVEIVAITPAEYLRLLAVEAAFLSSGELADAA
jgi:hypothetical protein